jgi:hypothetical protein
VQGFRQVENATAVTLREMVAGFGLHKLETYWSSLPPFFSAVVVYLDNEQWLDEPFVPSARSRGESWIVIDTSAKEASWLRQGANPSTTTRRATKGRTRTITASLRFQVLRRDDFCCVYCGRRPPDVTLHVDHVEAWSRGGSTSLDNLRSACSDCNVGKGARSI